MNEPIDPATLPGQEHLVAHAGTLPAEARQRFASDLARQDWARIARIHSQAGPGAPPHLPDGPFEPLPATAPSPAERDHLRAQGLTLLAQGRAAYVLMAGGQGSRLGYEGPKGACPIGLEGGLTLFAVIQRRLRRLGELCGRTPPLVVMTSPSNHGQTVAWFATHGDPAVPTEFFEQSVLPALDEEGRALLEAPGRLALAPDGNGGIFEALDRSGILARLQGQGVEWLHIAGVDNLLSLPCDPVFIAFTAQSGFRLGSKAVARRNAAERVGVFVRTASGRPAVAEYSDLDPERACAADSAGRLVFGAANIASHLVAVSLAAEFARAELPWHLARKKVAHIDPFTSEDRTQAGLACKYERFLFDAFPRSEGMALLDVERAAEFAPIKNASGEDSPESARQALQALHARWAAQWGGSPFANASTPFVDPGASYFGEPPGERAQAPAAA